MNIILFGPPGAGKGTQAVNLVKEFQLHKISIGDILRNEIENNTSLGIKIKSTIDKGSFVSDDIINDLVQKIITNKKINNNLIFDGYPRNLNQAKELDLMVKQNSQVISCVLSLNVDKEVVVKRILGRRICSNCGMIFNIYFSPSTKQNHKCEEKYLQKRTDDTEKVIKKRFDTYKNETLPILNFYKEQNLLHQINGMAKIDDISKEIRGIIASIET